MSIPRLGLPSRSRGNRPGTSYRPRLEALEDRLLLSGGFSPFGSEDEGGPEQGTDPLAAVTYSIDPGSRLAPLLAASSPQDLPLAMSQVWNEVQLSDIPGRALALARQISRAGPDVVGLEGVALWTVNGAPRYDFLRLLRRDLRGLGSPYLPVAGVAVNVLQLPDAGGNRIDLQERTVILMDTGMLGRGFVAAREGAGAFNAQRTVQVGGPQGPTVALLDTWAGINLVNLQEPDHTFRFVAADLDPVDPAVNAAQGRELLAGPLRTPLPVVVGADFGSPPGGSAAYTEVLFSGYYDVWLAEHPRDPGPTATEPALRDLVRHLQTRSDSVLVKQNEDMQSVSAALLGAGPLDRTASGLWASDHAGVLGHVELP